MNNPSNSKEEKLPLGVFTHLGDDPMQMLNTVREYGFPTCQIQSPGEDYLSGERVPALNEALRETGVAISSMFIGFQGQVWDLVQGPETIGFVPLATREQRVIHARRVSDLARMIDLHSVTSHVGFIPEDPNDPAYPDLVAVLRDFALYCRNNGQTFCFETGQETPWTLRRAIEDIGTGNLGINLDPANLLMYGKAHPQDAVHIIGEFVRNTHCKDGCWPREAGKLGPEMPLGDGMVDFPRLIAKLKAIGYSGPLTIEREISGEQQIKDILRAKQMLEAIA